MHFDALFCSFTKKSCVSRRNIYLYSKVHGADRTQVGPMLAPWSLLCWPHDLCYVGPMIFAICVLIAAFWVFILVWWPSDCSPEISLHATSVSLVSHNMITAIIGILHHISEELKNTCTYRLNGCLLMLSESIELLLSQYGMALFDTWCLALCPNESIPLYARLFYLKADILWRTKQQNTLIFLW